MKIRVSIIEDHETTAHQVINILKSDQDFEFVEWYSNGEKALKEITKYPPHIVIVDLGLPGMDGVECIKNIREWSQEIRLLVFTVFEEENMILKALEAGANGYLLKDTEASLFLAELKVIHLGGASMSPSIAAKIVHRLMSNKSSIPANSPSISNAEISNGKTNGTDVNRVLTKREMEILNLVSLGFVYTDIADDLDISPHTVRRHIENIYKKLNVHSRSEAIIMSRRSGIIDACQ